MDFQTLLKQAQQRLQNAGIQIVEEDNESQKTLKQDLLHCYSMNLVELHTWQADFAAQAGTRPKVTQLAVYQARHEQPLVNQRHELVTLDPLSKHLILMLDGTKNRTILVENLRKLFADGAIEIRRGSETLTKAREVEAALPKILHAGLQDLARFAFLVQ